MENPTTTISSDTRTTASNSPEFEFRNPSSHHTTIISADQLFSDGVLLPLRLLSTDDPPDPPPTNPPSITPGSDLKTTVTTASKRWKDIFKKNPENKDKEKKKKKDRSSGGGVGTGTAAAAAAAELNINLWPFSRSRSAGNSRPPRTVAGNRKVSSAPCSRSNSTGDKYRKWPTSPGRVGVHLGRSSPVWQAKRFGQSRSLHDTVVRSSAEKNPRPAKSSISGAGAGAGSGDGTKVLNINVPTCMGYRQRTGCQSDVSKEDLAGGVAGGNGGVRAVGAGGDGGASGLFSLRSLFTKKVF